MSTLDRIAAILNRLIATDSLARARFADMAGRVVQVCLRDSSQSVFVGLERTGLMLATRCPRPPDVRLEGSPAELLAMVGRGGDARGPGGVRIEGEVALVRQLQTALADLRVDWEELLAEQVGDVAAHQIGRVARGLARWSTHVRRSLERDLGDYVLYEAALVPGAAEIDGFTRDTLLLAEDVDKLGARIARLQASRVR